MMRSDGKVIDQEPFHSENQHLVCWKSIFAGLLISILSYMILTALGAGIGGVTAFSIVNNEESGSGLATAAGVWLGITAAVSLVIGSHFAARLSGFVTHKMGAFQGGIVAALFFIVLIYGAGHAVGSLSKGVGKMVGAFGSSAADVASNPSVQDTVNKGLGSRTLRSDPATVSQGVAFRLLRGDVESAKNYYAYQTNSNPAEVEAKVNQMKADFDQKVKEALDTSARAIAEAGWSLFVTFLVGLIAAVLGGIFGAKANFGKPLARRGDSSNRVSNPVL